MIRVTGGAWRGRRLRVPVGVGTRPTAARLREAMFSSLGERLRGAAVADLFAGGGTLGIEALSRGARHVSFVEIDPRALRTLRRNLEELGAPEGHYRIHRGDARRWLARLEADDRRAEPAPQLVLLDPPYDPEEPGRLLPLARRLLESGVLSAFVLEHPADAMADEAEEPAGLRRITRRHGQSAFTLLERSTA